MGRFCLVLALLGLALAGCATNHLDERQAATARIATDAGWQRFTVETGSFALAGFAPPQLKRNGTLTIYIEGDGLAWLDAETPSFNPTPLDPVALRLALNDPSGHAVYLARPCQYVTGKMRHGCAMKYWTGSRFSPAVIEATDQAINQLKQRTGSSTLILVGYSGGGAVAALVAARRQDVRALITVAGNLDPVKWAQLLRVAPLQGSLNPADAWQSLQRIPQYHFVGGADKMVPPAVALAYQSRFPPGQRPAVHIVDGYTHACCWDRNWPELLRMARKAVSR
jgi:dienelactone hydrolase